MQRDWETKAMQQYHLVLTRKNLAQYWHTVLFICTSIYAPGFSNASQLDGYVWWMKHHHGWRL